MTDEDTVICPNCKGRDSTNWPFGVCTVCKGTGKTTPERRAEIIAAQKAYQRDHSGRRG